jgi:DNA-binding transcriptional LysR family regulator
MDLDWNDLKFFLHVARLGGLTQAAATTGLSAATLGRRVTALEHQIGRALFHRSQIGYRLTRAGEDLLAHAEEVEVAMRSLINWREGELGHGTVRVSAGTWTTAFLAARIGELWRVEDPFYIEFVTAYQKVDIGRRNADIGIRSDRPTEPGLAGRKVGEVAHAIYSGRKLVNGVAAGLFVGVTGDGAKLRSARWMMAHHGDRIGVSGNDTRSVRDLVASGAGLSIFPCFARDDDPALVRVAPPIAELRTEQWLVMHNEERHQRPVREVAGRITSLLRAQAPLFRGERPHE